MDFLSSSRPLDTGQYTSYYVDPYAIGAPIDLEYRQIGSVLADGGDTFGVSSVTFDKYEELLWMGNQGGHVTSYYGPAMQKYTSFQVHVDEEIRSLLSVDSGILALTKSTLKHHIRRGLPTFTYKSCNMLDMQCLMAVNENRIILGGHQNKLIDFDLKKLKEVNQHMLNTAESSCAILRQNDRLVAVGDPCGKISLHDPVSLKTQHVMETHSASLSDFDVQDNLLVSCGFSTTGDSLSCDCFLLAYDIRTLRPLSPFALCCEPMLLRFLPPSAGHLAAIASQGRVQLLNTIHLQTALNLFQVDTQNSQCLSFDVSSTGQSLVFGDQNGHLHMYSLELGTADPIFNDFSRETEFADTPEEIPSVSITDETFLLSSIPLPPLPPGRKLLSELPIFAKRGYRQPKPIDPEILKSMKMQGPIGCAPNPQTTLRNQIPYVFDKPASPAHSKNVDNSAISNVVDSDSNTFMAIPKRYRKVEVRYSKLGSNDFDFEHYNRTGFPGLEANLPNSYCNAMLQVLYYTLPIKIALLNHECGREFCLSCELGFLFQMLDTSSSGTPCQASNFLRAFRTVPEASALGLILSNNPEARSKTNLASLIQSWNRFILHQMHYEILETRKKVNNKDNHVTVRSVSDRLTMMRINTYGNHVMSSLWEEFSYKECEFPEIGKKVQKKKEGDEDKNGEDESIDEAIVENADDIVASTLPDDSTKETPKKENTEETEISSLFGTKQLQIHKCLKCNHEERKETVALLYNLHYPNQIPSDTVSFVNLLKGSLCPRRTTPAWCENCQKFTPTSQCCSVRELPDLLSINCGLTTANDKLFWQKQMDNMISSTLGQSSVHEKIVFSPSSSLITKPCRYANHCSRPGCKFKHPDDPPHKSQPMTNNSTAKPHNPSSSARSLNQLYIQNPWLPHEFEAFVSEGELKIERTDINGLLPKNNISSYNSTNNAKLPLEQNGLPERHENEHSVAKKQYSLSAIVCHVEDNPKNIVSFIKMNNDANKSSEGQSQWFLFNDFCISPVSAAEVTWFNLEWKVPCVLFYYNKAAEPIDMTSAPINNSSWQQEDGRLAASKALTFTPLGAHEMPKAGELVGIDAEFVTLNQEESELKSDGRLSTIRPSHLSVARITCIRGQGPMEGTPFIDDYISTQEQVVDYLTKFSGIKPGDLDANFSSKHLTTLKSSYQKLRYLVDTGVVFVGHGLQNDFKVINLVVPPEQVIDTVQLFYLPHHRMVSLKFLAWHLLGTKIQSDTHDSTEDARTALQLYKRYVELDAKGAVPASLASLYEAGKALHWKVPDDDDD